MHVDRDQLKAMSLKLTRVDMSLREVISTTKDSQLSQVARALRTTNEAVQALVAEASSKDE